MRKAEPVTAGMTGPHAVTAPASRAPGMCTRALWVLTACAAAACASPGSGSRGQDPGASPDPAALPRPSASPDPAAVPRPSTSPDPAAVPGPGSRVFRDCPHCPEMAVIPAGRFVMGSPTWNAGPFDGDGPPRFVTIAYDFAIGVYEVTFDEWQACTDGGGCGGRVPPDHGWGRGRRPVTEVSWDDAHVYARWLSAETGETYRLPTEAEWEYAARAGTRTPRYWGDSEAEQCRHANGWDREYGGTPRGRQLREQFGLTTASCSDGQGEGTAPVGSYEPNAFGLYDVIGNLAEWTEDCWNANYADAPDDGGAWSPSGCERRVLRGGTWGYTTEMLRVDYRLPFQPGRRDNGLGFRVARVIRPPG